MFGISSLVAVACLSVAMLPACSSGRGGSEVPMRVGWVSVSGGEGISDLTGMAAFPDGSAVITGLYQDYIIFDAGLDSETRLDGDLIHKSIYVAKYTPDGTFDFAVEAACDEVIFPTDLAAFDDGSFAVTGWLRGPAVFGAGTADETVLVPEGWDQGSGEVEADLFLARYAADGAFQWALAVGGRGGDAANEIAALPDGSCLITGAFSWEATFGPGEPNETVLQPSIEGDRDLFIARYGASGQLEWAVGDGGPSLDSGESISVVDEASFVVTGRFTGSTTFGAGQQAETTLVSDSADHSNLFLAKFSSDGSLIWARGGYSNGGVSGTSITALQDGALLLAGGYSGQQATLGRGEPGQVILEQPNPPAVFIARYTQDGQLAWVNQWDDVDGQGVAGASSIAALPGGAAVVSGSIQGAVGFGQTHAGDLVVESRGNNDGFVMEIDADGDAPWLFTLGGDSDLPFEGVDAVAVVDSASVLVAGYFLDRVVFGEGLDDPQTLLADDMGDGFLMRLDPAGR